MTSRLHLLLATCALALIQLASGQAQCGEVHWGRQTNGTYILAPEYLERGLRNFYFKRETPSRCGILVGGQIVACDYDTSPNLTLIKGLEVFIQRTGELTLPGIVFGTAFCNPLPEKIPFIF
ncbi:uncharacterized protein LOC142985260 [Anticarsia gemmatalis]|uniref:uncharacterized protein LOC142985260 n=1 Tax=Anticarsia gemmatalis TaxID=129554 RepID=UPI003F76487E